MDALAEMLPEIVLSGTRSVSVHPEHAARSRELIRRFDLPWVAWNQPVEFRIQSTVAGVTQTRRV